MYSVLPQSVHPTFIIYIYFLREREREKTNPDSKTLILKDSSVRSIWTFLTASPRERERERERLTEIKSDKQKRQKRPRGRETENDRCRERQRQSQRSRKRDIDRQTERKEDGGLTMKIQFACLA